MIGASSKKIGIQFAGKRLYATPSPLPGESCASWIQRMAGAHQYGTPRLMHVLSFKPHHHDWDLPIPKADWMRVSFMGCIGRGGGHSLQILERLIGRSTRESRLLLDGTCAKYRWCSECFASDDVPYLRWHWRLDSVRSCAVHGRPLCETCPSCNRALLVNRCRLVPFGQYVPIQNLASCDACGCSLHHPKPAPHPHAQNSHDPLLTSVRTVDAAALQGDPAWLSAQILKLRADLALPDQPSLPRRPRRNTAITVARPSKNEASLLKPGLPLGAHPHSSRQNGASLTRANARAAFNLRRWRKLTAWVLNAACYADPDAAANHPAAHWSWRLSGTRRIAVARALLAVRRERIAVRLNSGMP